MSSDREQSPGPVEDTSQEAHQVHRKGGLGTLEIQVRQEVGSLDLHVEALDLGLEGMQHTDCTEEVLEACEEVAVDWEAVLDSVGHRIVEPVVVEGQVA
jgi:hypothetical protein